jgi:hypothetical protein
MSRVGPSRGLNLYVQKPPRAATILTGGMTGSIEEWERETQGFVLKPHRFAQDPLRVSVHRSVAAVQPEDRQRDQDGFGCDPDPRQPAPDQRAYFRRIALYWVSLSLMLWFFV